MLPLGAGEVAVSLQPATQSLSSNARSKSTRIFLKITGPPERAASLRMLLPHRQAHAIARRHLIHLLVEEPLEGGLLRLLILLRVRGLVRRVLLLQERGEGARGIVRRTRRQRARLQGRSSSIAICRVEASHRIAAPHARRRAAQRALG